MNKTLHQRDILEKGIKLKERLTNQRKQFLSGLLIINILFMGTGCQRHANEEQPVGENSITNNEVHGGTSLKEIESQSDDSSYLILVNETYGLSADYVPDDLVLPNILDFYHNPTTTIYLRETAAYMVEQLFQAAFDEQGLVLLGRSGYRSYDSQAKIHNNYIAQYGYEETQKFSAAPGHSEHQTGLALDVTANSVGGRLDIGFGQTAEGIWLKQNAHRFGFIISYPEGREEDTGFMYEPWHIRYVGVEAATIIFENGWILEEYLTHIGQMPTH